MKLTWHSWGWLSVSSLFFLVGCPDPPVQPITPCTVNGVSINVDQAPITQVDVLFMIDNSVSMTAEQAELGSKISRMIEILTSGDLDGDKLNDFPAVEDLHVGIVTSDMGVGREDKNDGLFVPPKSCSDDPIDGDDGVLQKGDDNGCGDADSPLFLSYDPESPDDFDTDFSCYAAVGSDGCGFEQQLEATLKALTPAIPGVEGMTFVTGAGHEDNDNDGFLREDSVLALIVVTDEEDCSAADPFFYHSPRPKIGVQCYDNNGRCYQDTPAGLRCSEKFGFGDTDAFPNAMHPVQRYIDGLLAMRSDPGKLVFAAIAGVPDGDDEEAYLSEDDQGIPVVNYEALLAHDKMQEVEQDICTNRGGGVIEVTNNLRPVCGKYPTNCTDKESDTAAEVDAFEYAVPARRIVKVAQGLQASGANTIVQSSCKAEYDDALTAIGKLIGRIVSKFCLPRDLDRDSEGRVDCDVIETLPTEGDFVTCESMSSRGRVAFDPPRIEDGREVCKVTQRGVTDAKSPTESGWYYDNFTTGERVEACGEDGQRIAFIEGSEPPNGASTRLECASAVESTDAGGESDLGAKCDDGEPCPDDPVNGELFCEEMSKTCRYACTTNADCPTASLSCNTTTGACVNPTCN